MLHVPPTPASAPRRLLISFSGGETSGLMAKLCKERLSHLYDEIVVVFANTGEENEQTLLFVDRCDEAFGLNVVWIEAVVDPAHGKGTRARVVDFPTASRNGEPFEAMIAKYGIPNQSHPHCTRELKSRPIKAYARQIGWESGSYEIAIGIRCDEIDRMAVDADGEKTTYPLIKHFPRRKLDVNEFWSKQPFRLDLKGYEGNCRWCWKKTLRKHLTIVTAHPERYDFPERMEQEHAMSGHNANGEPRSFFRKHMTALDIRRLAETVPFDPAEDDARVYDRQLDLIRLLDVDHTGAPALDPSAMDMMLDLDMAGGCSESCEAF